MSVKAHRRSRRGVVAVAGAMLALVVPFGGHDRASAVSASCPTLTIAGDDNNAVGHDPEDPLHGGWGFHDTYYTQLRGFLTDTARFGPNGVVKTSYVIGSPVGDANGIPDANAFAGRNVFVSGAANANRAQANYTANEKTLIRNFVLGGGAALIITNKADFGDGASIFGFTTKVPNAFFTPSSGYPAFRAPNGASMIAGTPFQNGPFGAVTQNPGMFHTVASFSSVPAGWLVGATLTITGQTNGDNNVDNQPVLAYIRAGVLGPGSGPVVVASDLDLFSNAYNGLTDTAPSASNQMLPANQTLTLNTFAWIANQMCTADSRVTVVAGGDGSSPTRVASVAANTVPVRTRTAAPSIR